MRARTQSGAARNARLQRPAHSAEAAPGARPQGWRWSMTASGTERPQGMSSASARAPARPEQLRGVGVVLRHKIGPRTVLRARSLGRAA